ncbi:uncharacterized protein [Halyomorpha halys]|uniref:uncharacterized protein n=1 Tax=Halyomorpha halys TaxID=286706 RepID=UPI0034D32623
MSQFKCNLCGKSIGNLSNLRRHEKSCNGNSAYTCKKCGKSYSNSGNGKRHENVCIGGPPLKKSKLSEPEKNEVLALTSDNEGVSMYETAFQNRLASFFIRSTDCMDINSFLESVKNLLVDKIRDSLHQHRALKLNFLLECTFTNSIGQNTDRAFKTRNKRVFKSSDLGEFVEQSFIKIITEAEESQFQKSGWMLSRVDGIRLRINRYSPLRGGTYLPLPSSIESKKACINVKNYDKCCFKYSILAKEVSSLENNPQRVTKYKDFKHPYDFNCVSFPTSLREVSKFEERNNMSINVYGLDENENVYPLKVCKIELKEHRDLLLLSLDQKSHYVYIKNFEKLVGNQISKHEHELRICRSCFTHFDNQYGKQASEKLEEHKEYCFENKPVRIVLPKKNPFIRFSNVERQSKVPFVIYADFESILVPINESSGNTTKYQRHDPISFCIYVKGIEGVDIPICKPYLYRGVNAASHFMKYITKIAKQIENIYKKNKPLRISSSEEEDWDKAETCYLCKQQFKENNEKVRDHCHLTGTYLGPSCNNCNLKRVNPSFIPVIMHNLSNYDAHFIVKELGGVPGRVEVIPSNEEKYISFTKHVGQMKLRFIDSYRFMAHSLDYLVKSLSVDKFKETSKYYRDEELTLVTRKGVFPYDYIDSAEKLNETQLPPIEAFHNKLYDADISIEDYTHALNIWKQFKCQSLGHYVDVYVKTDVLLLCDVFESFRNVMMKTHGLDPVHYYTVPGLTFDAMLKHTKVKIELLQDYDMILMIERGIRGGLCQVSHRYAEANNKYMSTLNSNEKSSYIIYLDANNLYGQSMSMYLPYGGFEWVQNPESINISDLKDDDEIGYIFEIDISYPQQLHDSHYDLPFLPETIVPPRASSKSKKLITHFEKRNHYVLYYRNLIQAIKHGLKLEKIHRALKFKQSPWLRSYIEFNTELRKGASNDFEKDFYKLLNNAVFGKTMENVRNHLDIQLVTDSKKLMKLIAKPNFIDRTIYNENLAAVHMGMIKIEYNKPVYIGMCILDLSKTVMYQFHYDTMMKKYSNNTLKMMYTDTDSFIYRVLTEDVYEDMKKMNQYFDFSDYPKTHICYSEENKKKLGKFKDEVNSEIILKYVGLRAKMYSFITENVVKKRAKGVQKSSLEKCINFEDYEKVLLKNEVMHTPMRLIQSKQHNVYSSEINKISLSALDDKRHILEDGVNTMAYGHYKLNEMKK